jgi:hypothetical protein
MPAKAFLTTIGLPKVGGVGWEKSQIIQRKLKK